MVSIDLDSINQSAADQ